MTYSQADIWYDSIAGIDRRGQSAGQWDAAGHFLWTYFRCWGNVRVIIGGGGKTFCDGGNAALKSVWADTLIASGAVSAIWLKGPLTHTSQCDAPGKPTCYTFTGSHAVTVTSADAELSLVPSRYVVYPGNASITFTGSALPSM